MNRWFNRVLWVIFLCLISANLWGDSLIMTENRVYAEVWAESFTGAPENIFIIKMVKEGRPDAQGFPVPENNVINMMFKPLGEAQELSGRRADMTLSGDRVFKGVTVLKYENREDGGVFTIRPADAAPDNQGFPVRSATIKKIQLIGAATPTPAPTVASLSDLLVATPSPTPAPPKPTEMPSSSTLSSTPEGPPSFLEGPAPEQATSGTKQTYTRSERLFDQDKEPNIDENRFFGLGKIASNKEGKFIIGLILRAIGAIISGFVIWLSCRSAGAPMPFLKSILTAAIISIAGGIVWWLCMFIPICGVNLLIALVAWFFTARAIIMGMAEVMEEKATTIVITIIIINVVLYVGVMFLIVGGLALALAG